MQENQTMAHTGKSHPFDNLHQFLDTKEGKEALTKAVKQTEEREKKYNRIQQTWEGRFKKHWLDKERFYEWMDKMVTENSEVRTRECYDRGEQPSPNMRLSRTFSLVERTGSPLTARELRKYSGGFSARGWRFQTYVFLVTSGQGTAYTVYKNGKAIISLA